MSFSYQIDQCSVPLENRKDMSSFVLKKYNISVSDLISFKIVKLSLDSRKKNRIQWSLNALLTLKKEVDHKELKSYKDNPNSKKNRVLDEVLDMPEKVVVVGSGPSGLWAALSLLRKGFKVELHEQGQPVEKRFKDIRSFIKKGEFNARSNVLFGEGGAGTFSDGKLTSRANNPYTRQVLQDIADASDNNEVLYMAKPHIGTDKLQFIVKQLREWIIDLGGEVFFDSKLDDIEVTNGAISSASFNGVSQNCKALVLAVGHSARDIYELLDKKGVALEAKSFAMGVRIEHDQNFINTKQLGDRVDIKMTGVAEYFLNVPDTKESKGAYSFCMCPGGVVIPCASEEGMLTTNGMSYSRRNSPFANAAIVVPVDYSQDGLFRGIEVQRKLEQDAFVMAGSNYGAPAQTIKSFLNRRVDKELPKSSFQRDLVPCDLNELFPPEINEPLRAAMPNFERKIPGFIEKGVMIAPEARTSSPIRILRDTTTFESVNIKGLFPLGEGAGYSGGIISSAADGVKLAAVCKSMGL